MADSDPAPAPTRSPPPHRMMPFSSMSGGSVRRVVARGGGAGLPQSSSSEMIQLPPLQHHQRGESKEDGASGSDVPVVRIHVIESKEDVETRAPAGTSSSARPTSASVARSSAAASSAAALPAQDEAIEAVAAASSSSEDEDDKGSGPTAAEVYSRPLLFYKRATVDRHRRNVPAPPELGPAQLILPDSGMALGFPPLKDSGASRRARREEPPGGEAVVVFTPPNEEQASKTKLWACILFFLIPADVILICTIFFLGGAVIDDQTYNAGTTDLVTFLCALIALVLGLVGMKLRDTRLLTLFIVIYYVDAIINLVRVSSILQLAQFFMQVGVCHAMSHFKASLVGVWWVADT